MNQPKYQVRLSSNKKDVQIVNTRPENGKRISIVGLVSETETHPGDKAVFYAECLNRQDSQIEERLKSEVHSRRTKRGKRECEVQKIEAIKKQVAKVEDLRKRLRSGGQLRP